MNKKLSEKEVLHVLRNPFGHSQTKVRQARLQACDMIESYQDAYLNMRHFAEENGLDTATYGGKGD